MINFTNVTYEIEAVGKNVIRIIDDVSFKVDRGEIFGIAGQSGGGKTSIAKLLSGVNKLNSGSITIGDKDIKNYLSSGKLQILFQNNNELINPLRRVYDIIDEVLFTEPENIKRKRISELIGLMKLPEEIIYKKGFELSGGQQQRVALARVLAADPEIIIMDEPFSAQDTDSQNIISNLITELNSNYGITIIIISHDLVLLRDITHKIIIIKEGKIIEEGETEKVLSNPDHPHTQFLIRSVTYDLNENDLERGL